MMGAGMRNLIEAQGAERETPSMRNKRRRVTSCSCRGPGQERTIDIGALAHFLQSSEQDR